jgi:MFS superfamily sulfate permease-like transporter
MSYSFYRIVLAVVAAALVACFFTIITATADQVEAGARSNVVSGNRLDERPIGPQCAQRAWPYYEAHCLRDLRPRNEQPKTVRVVTTERW